MAGAARGFLDAICADPADDTPRLVYADWLQEHGDGRDAERAEFIRVQCRLAKGCKSCDGTGRNVMSPCPCAALRSRERYLFESLGANPFADGFDILCAVGLDDDIPLRTPTPPFVVVRRGFADEVRMELRGWNTLWPQLRRAAPLRAVRLVTDSGCDLLPPLRRLCCPLSDAEDSVRGLDTLDLSRVIHLDYHLLGFMMRDSYRPWRGLHRLVLPNWAVLENRYHGHEAQRWGKWVPGLREVVFGERVMRLCADGTVEDAGAAATPPPRHPVGL